MARSTRSSWIPRSRSWEATMRSRLAACSSAEGPRFGRSPLPSVDVVVERLRVMHEDLSAPGGDHPGAFELGEEAARALARRSGELRDLGLRRPDEHLPRVGIPLGGDRANLSEERAGHAPLDGLEGLARQPFVRRPDP